MFPAWDPTALRLVAPMKGIANLRSQPPHRGILRISPTNILLTHELLRKVAQAELISEHHLGKTIIKEAENRKIILKDEIPEGEVIKGNGICATVEDEQLIIGNRKLLQNKNILLVPHIESYAIEREKLGNTAIFVAINGNVEAIISIADEIRDDAKDALITLKKSGIKKMYMLTGDNEHTAKLVAKQLNLDGYFAELLPQDKEIGRAHV